MHFRVLVEVDVKAKSGIGAQDYIRNALANKNAVLRVVDCKALELSGRSIPMPPAPNITISVEIPEGGRRYP